MILIRLSLPRISAIPNPKCNEQTFDLAVELGEGLAAVSEGLWFVFGFGSGEAFRWKCQEKHQAPGSSSRKAVGSGVKPRGVEPGCLGWHAIF